jgi:hypothetical protein
VETYILLCDRHPPRPAGAGRSVRLLAGLIGTTVAAILSFSGPRLSAVAEEHPSLSTVAEATAAAPHAVGRSA